MEFRLRSSALVIPDLFHADVSPFPVPVLTRRYLPATAKWQLQCYRRQGLYLLRGFWLAAHSGCWDWITVRNATDSTPSRDESVLSKQESATIGT